MNAQIKAKWIAALRSGKYSQTHGSLYMNSGYCCLGVLCELHSQATGGLWIGAAYLGQEDYPPNAVIRWAGLSSPNPTTPLGRLSILNDGVDKDTGHLDQPAITFAAIADIIEQYL